MFSTEELEYIRQKYDEANDPNNSYSVDDFNKEFEHLTGQITDPRVSIKLINKSNNEDPSFATSGSSGFDIRANIDEPIILMAGERAVVPTGLYFAIPETLELQVRPRSGLAAKNGITVLNTPGTVDSDYRGEVKVILINLGNESFKINHGDRIAQGVVAPVMSGHVMKFEKVESLDETQRGEGGFGSTGSN
jgi:dUTP pyrophosphatase